MTPMTPREEVEELCVAAGLVVQALELTPKHVLVTVKPISIRPDTLIQKLYRLMRDLQTDWYSVTWREWPGEPMKELWFHALDTSKATTHAD